MIGKKVTLVAATAAKIADGGVGGRTVYLNTALTDLTLGGPGVTSAAGCAIPTGVTQFFIGNDDLYAISAAGGVVNVGYPENA